MDTIGNMLTSLMNAQRVGKTRVYLPHSEFKQRLAELLRDKGYVAKVEAKDGMPKRLVVTLRYDGNEGRMRDVKRLSSPGRRLYVGKNDIPYSVDGVGIVVLSTSRGLVDDTQARKEGLGGELICEVW